MKKDSVLKLRPDIEYVRKWTRQFETKHGECEATTEILKILDYLELVEDEFDRRELYLEAFMKLTERDEVNNG